MTLLSPSISQPGVGNPICTSSHPIRENYIVSKTGTTGRRGTASVSRLGGKWFLFIHRPRGHFPQIFPSACPPFRRARAHGKELSRRGVKARRQRRPRRLLPAALCWSQRWNCSAKERRREGGRQGGEGRGTIRRVARRRPASSEDVTRATPGSGGETGAGGCGECERRRLPFVLRA